MLRIVLLCVCVVAQTDMPAHCVYGGWTAWGECTAPCAGGVRTRHRPLDTGTPSVHRELRTICVQVRHSWHTHASTVTTVRIH
jgi:hypothetical protein